MIERIVSPRNDDDALALSLMANQASATLVEKSFSRGVVTEDSTSIQMKTSPCMAVVKGQYEDAELVECEYKTQQVPGAVLQAVFLVRAIMTVSTIVIVIRVGNYSAEIVFQARSLLIWRGISMRVWCCTIDKSFECVCRFARQPSHAPRGFKIHNLKGPLPRWQVIHPVPFDSHTHEFPSRRCTASLPPTVDSHCRKRSRT